MPPNLNGPNPLTGG